MEHFTVIVVERAERDLREIADYIAIDSPQNSREVKEELRATIRSLENFPNRSGIFETNKDPAKVVRSITVKSFKVFYRVIESALIVEILSVRRGTRRRPKRFFPR